MGCKPMTTTVSQAPKEVRTLRNPLVQRSPTIDLTSDSAVADANVVAGAAKRSW